MSDETIDIPEAPGTVEHPDQTANPPEGNETDPTKPTEPEKPWKQEQRVPLREHVELRTKFKAARDEASFLRGQLEAIRNGGQQAPQAPEARPGQNAPDPLDPSNFSTPQEWVKAVKEAAKAETMEAIRAESHGASQQETASKAVQSYTTKIHEAAVQIPDIVQRAEWFEEQVAGRINPDLGMEILEHPMAAQLVAELTDNPEALRSILDPNPVKASRALGMLEARISSRTTAPQTNAAPPVPNAPAPQATPRVNGGGSAPVQRTLAYIAKHGTDAEYEAARRSGIQ